jgi:hypothetical protein
MSQSTKNEIEILRRIHYKSLSEMELMELFAEFKSNQRVILALVSHPAFPQQMALQIISRLYPVDLLKLVKNKRANPFVRKRAEIEFGIKYKKLPLGEKISFLKMAPIEILYVLVEENDGQLIKIMLSNPNCTEAMVLKMIHRVNDRFQFYEALLETEWFKQPQVVEAVIHDSQAPIRLLITMLPFMNKKQLKCLYDAPNVHQIVQKQIVEFMLHRGGLSEKNSSR